MKFIKRENIVETEPMVLKDRLDRGYYVGTLIRNNIGVWCAFHHYNGRECTETLYDTFSEALEAQWQLQQEEEELA